MEVLGGFLEILRFGSGDVDEGLGVAINQGEPGALNVDDDAVASAKSVANVRKGEFNRSNLAGDEGFGFLKTVAEFTPENVAAHKLLITAKFNFIGVRLRIDGYPKGCG